VEAVRCAGTAFHRPRDTQPLPLLQDRYEKAPLLVLTGAGLRRESLRLAQSPGKALPARAWKGINWWLSGQTCPRRCGGHGPVTGRILAPPDIQGRAVPYEARYARI